jgi:hypothetical protein
LRQAHDTITGLAEGTKGNGGDNPDREAALKQAGLVA